MIAGTFFVLAAYVVVEAETKDGTGDAEPETYLAVREGLEAWQGDRLVR